MGKGKSEFDSWRRKGWERRGKLSQQGGGRGKEGVEGVISRGRRWGFGLHPRDLLGLVTAGGWSWGKSGRRLGPCICISIFPNVCSKLLCSTHPCTSFPHASPRTLAWENPVRINKSSRLLRDKGWGMETVWGPDISLMCNNLVVRSRNKTPFLEPLLILAPNA